MVLGCSYKKWVYKVPRCVKIFLNITLYRLQYLKKMLNALRNYFTHILNGQLLYPKFMKWDSVRPGRWKCLSGMRTLFRNFEIILFEIMHILPNTLYIFPNSHSTSRLWILEYPMFILDTNWTQSWNYVIAISIVSVRDANRYVYISKITRDYHNFKNTHI